MKGRRTCHLQVGGQVEAGRTCDLEQRQLDKPAGHSGRGDVCARGVRINIASLTGRTAVGVPKSFVIARCTHAGGHHELDGSFYNSRWGCNDDGLGVFTKEVDVEAANDHRFYLSKSDP